jgi:hypothetical protein
MEAADSIRRRSRTRPTKRLNPIIPNRPTEEQSAPPVPTLVVAPEVVQERVTDADRIQIAAKVWALLEFDDLARAQAAIDWSRDAGARLFAFVRSHQGVGRWVALATLLALLYLWAS